MRKYKVKTNEINYQLMIKDLLCAVKYTSQIHGWNSHDQLNETIKSIIYRNMYELITGKKGFRDNIRKYSSDDFVNLIIEYSKSTKDRINNYIIKQNENYIIDENIISYLVDNMCNNYLNECIDNIAIEYPNNNIVNKPQEVIYNKPSNECREAVMSGKQTKISSSSAICNGMTAYSDVGLNRNNQEDSYYIGVHPSNPNFKIMAVADGMGGHEGGEIASNLAIKHLIEWFEKLDAREYYNTSNTNIYEKFLNEVEKMNQDINNHTNGGTTLCVSIVKNDSILTFNIGDSKGYIFENNELIFNTIPEDMAHFYKIQEPLTRFYKQGNTIYNYLGCGSPNGIPIPKYDVISIKPENSYKIVLCSDGVTDCLGDKKIVDISTKDGNVAQALVERALENDSYLMYELKSIGFFARRKIDESLYKGFIPKGKDNTTAIFGEIEPKIELQGRKR